MALSELGLFSQAIILFAALVLFTAFIMLGQTRTLPLIFTFAWQGVLLGVVTALVAVVSGHHELFVSAALTVVLKVVLIPWLLYRLSGSVTLLGVLGFAGSVPILLLAPFAGLWSDRFNLHRMMFATQILEALQAAALAALALLSALPASAASPPARVAGVARARDRQPHGHRRPPPGRARDVDAAPMLLGDRLRDRQAEPGAAGVARARRVGAVEAVEQPVALGLLDAGAVVAMNGVADAHHDDLLGLVEDRCFAVCCARFVMHRTCSFAGLVSASYFSRASSFTMLSGKNLYPPNIPPTSPLRSSIPTRIAL